MPPVNSDMTQMLGMLHSTLTDLARGQTQILMIMGQDPNSVQTESSSVETVKRWTPRVGRQCQIPTFLQPKTEGKGASMALMDGSLLNDDGDHVAFHHRLF